MVRPEARLSPVAIGALAAFAIPALFLMAAAHAGLATFARAEYLLEGLTMAPLTGPLSPLSMLVVQASLLLPFGPLTLRVATVLAWLLSLSALAVFLAAVRAVRGLGLHHDELSVPLALACSWVALSTSPLWELSSFQDGRAVALCLSTFILERLSAAIDGRDRARPWAQASFLLGLLVVEAPLWAGFALTVSLVTLSLGRPGPLSRRASLRALLLGLGSVALSLPRLPHALRYQPALLDQGGLGAAAPSLPRDALTLIFLAGAAAGAVLALGRGQARPLTLAPFFAQVGLTLIGLLLPAAWGLQPMLWPLLIVAAAVFVVLPLAGLLTGTDDQPRSAGLALVIALCAVGFLSLQRASQMTFSVQPFAADALAEGTLTELSSDGVVLLGERKSSVLLQAAQQLTLMRPDLSFVEVNGPLRSEYVQLALRRQPALRALLSNLLLEGELSLPELQSLAGRVPVALTLAPFDVMRLSEALRPAQLLYEVLPGGVSLEDLKLSGQARTALLDRVYASGTPSGSMVTYLRERHRADALQAMALGSHPTAQSAIGHGLALQTGDATFMALRRFLADHADQGRLDISSLTE